MIIKNGLVYQEDKGFVPQTIHIENGLFTEPSDCSYTAHETTLDAQGCYVIPGLVDIHFHGCMGQDFSDGTPESLNTIASFQLANGTTSICPASMTLPINAISHICENAANWHKLHSLDSMSPSAFSRLMGIHLEEPFISPVKKGAQSPDYIISPDLSLLQKWNDTAGNLVRLITLAPELYNALDFIEQLKNTNSLSHIHVSLGHSNSDYTMAREAFVAGADHVTHLFNAMTPFNHRNTGIIGAALDTPHCYAELICDGIHVSAPMIRAAFSMFTDKRIVLISDSMRATGLTDGTYSLGGQDVTVQGKYARLSDGTIAGSVTTLLDCLRTAVSMGIPLESAVKCATIDPARSIGMEHLIGSITPGTYGDCIILNQNLEIIHIIKAGNNFLPSFF